MNNKPRLDADLVIHPFPPIFTPDSRVLILGTLPSVQSRRQGFYYGNPQNRFWQVLSTLLQSPLPVDREARQAFLIKHRIALWDVLQQCRIIGSQDGTIADPVANDLRGILAASRIRAVFANGQTAAGLYRQFCEHDTGMPCVALPSTSPANGRYSLADLAQAWQPVRDALAVD
jgi:double-stranded uracil-DNA glycosylase